MQRCWPDMQPCWSDMQHCWSDMHHCWSDMHRFLRDMQRCWMRHVLLLASDVLAAWCLARDRCLTYC
jgi:hypothetical protein